MIMLEAEQIADRAWRDNSFSQRADLADQIEISLLAEEALLAVE